LDSRVGGLSQDAPLQQTVASVHRRFLKDSGELPIYEFSSLRHTSGKQDT
jgi:hypothetical protein